MKACLFEFVEEEHYFDVNYKNAKEGGDAGCNSVDDWSVVSEVPPVLELNDLSIDEAFWRSYFKIWTLNLLSDWEFSFISNSTFYDVLGNNGGFNNFSSKTVESSQVCHLFL